MAQIKVSVTKSPLKNLTQAAAGAGLQLPSGSPGSGDSCGGMNKGERLGAESCFQRLSACGRKDEPRKDDSGLEAR